VRFLDGTRKGIGRLPARSNRATDLKACADFHVPFSSAEFVFRNGTESMEARTRISEKLLSNSVETEHVGWILKSKERKSP
jgi:hypothetical protein